jgi:hypothetical protein
MRKFKLVKILLLTSLTLTFNWALSDQTVFVQSQSTQVKKEAKPSSENLLEVRRGDELKLLSSQGMWLQVEINGKTGWIMKLLTSPNKPVGQADLVNASKINSEAKTSRRRSNEFAVSAAARGLTATERNRNSINKQRSNRQAVTDLENIKVDDKDLEQFKKEGQEQ